MGLKSLEDVTYFRLNNEINRPVNGQIMLHKDKEALDAFFKENVVPNTKTFDSITDKIQYLLEHNYIERAFIEKYRPEFLEELAQFIKDQNFQFKSFMAAYKFYNQYALKTNDGEYYLESMEDRVFFNALYFADGNEAIARDIANEIIHQRYQPATPSFLNAGRARRGELVSCFLIQVTDDIMRSDVPSTLPFNCLVSVVGLGFLSATFVKLEHQSKGMKEPLLEWFQL